VLTWMMPISAILVTPLSRMQDSALAVDAFAIFYGAFLMLWAVRPEAGQPVLRRKGLPSDPERA
ncbi:MAG: hypothetical protein ABF459_09750, partial [Gluconobacter cerinus]